MINLKIVCEDRLLVRVVVGLKVCFFAASLVGLIGWG